MTETIFRPDNLNHEHEQPSTVELAEMDEYNTDSVAMFRKSLRGIEVVKDDAVPGCSTSSYNANNTNANTNSQSKSHCTEFTNMITFETSTCHLAIKVGSEEFEKIRDDMDLSEINIEKSESQNEGEMEMLKPKGMERAEEDDDDHVTPFPLPTPRSPQAHHRRRSKSRSPRRSSASPSSKGGKKKVKPEVCEVSSDEDDDDNENPKNQHESFAQMSLKRKTLLKVEKITDDANRTRGKMRSRGLSPPSSSDDENLHIGWVAYPRESAMKHSDREGKRSFCPKGVSTICACQLALRLLTIPVRKAYQKCKNLNKVYDGDVSSTNSQNHLE